MSGDTLHHVIRWNVGNIAHVNAPYDVSSHFPSCGSVSKRIRSIRSMSSSYSILASSRRPKRGGSALRRPCVSNACMKELAQIGPVRTKLSPAAK